MQLSISKVKVYPYKKKSRTGVIGVGQVIFDGGLLLSGLELVERNNKQFITYPKNPHNNHGLCFCQPTNATLGNMISNALFEEYSNVISSNNYDESNNSFFEDAAKQLYDNWKQQVMEITINEAAADVNACANAVGNCIESKPVNCEDEITDPELNNEINVIE